MLYFRANSPDHLYGDEMVELIAHQLAIGVAILPVLDEFLPTLSPQDPTYENRLAGLTRMKRGLGTMVSAVLVILTETSTYGEEPLIRLGGRLETLLPPLLAALPGPTRLETLRRLETIAGQTRSSQLRSALERLKRAVKGSM